MEIVIFWVGVCLGSIGTQIIVRWKAGYGTFRCDVVENLEDTSVHVRIQVYEPPIGKKRLILDREVSQE